MNNDMALRLIRSIDRQTKAIQEVSIRISEIAGILEEGTIHTRERK